MLKGTKAELSAHARAIREICAYRGGCLFSNTLSCCCTYKESSGHSGFLMQQSPSLLFLVSQQHERAQPLLCQLLHGF